MIEVVRRLKGHLDSLDDRYTCFANLGFQSEGWFKGEILTVLSRLWLDGVVQELDREITVEGKRIDLMIHMDGVRHWIELKHWLIGRQKGFIYNPPFYFADRSSVGIVPDVDKLNRPSLSPADRRWLLLLLTANPSIAPWAAGVARFNDKFAPRRLASRTRPDEYPPTYFLGLLELMDGAGGLESGSGSRGVTMADLTIGESRYLQQLRTRLARLRSYLDEALLPDDATPERWYRYVAEIRAIQGNVSNDLSFIATLLAKQYLSTRFDIVDFDASTKAQGAPGLDIDVRTAEGARVIGEIKTTVPYAGARGDLGAAQKTTFQKDFDKLNREVAEHKFFFVTDETTYRLVRAKYATHIPGVDIVLLVADDFTSHSRSATAPIGLEETGTR